MRAIDSLRHSRLPSLRRRRDREATSNAILSEGRYPPLNPLISGQATDAEMATALFRPAAAQPVPAVATFFNVVIGQTGYVFSPRGSDGGFSTAVPRRSGPGGDSFRPIQCTYR